VRLWVAGLAGLVCSIAEPSATEACTCAAATIEDATVSTQVIVVGDVLDDRVAAVGHVARLRVVEALRGARAGAELDVRWIPPDGKSCFFISLRQGRWLLFLEQNADGTLSTLACDANSTLLGGAQAASTLAAVRAALAPGAPHGKAVERAIPVANHALDRAYARQHAEVHPPRHDPWVSAAGATVHTVAGGWRVCWTEARPAGFSYEVEVEVPPKGAPRALKAAASYSPD
jgi:hypothetical protein